MYYDKRFQTDIHFPFIAFSHRQISTASTDGWLLAKKPKFDDISQRLLEIDHPTLNKLIQRLSAGEHVQAETEAEKQCYKVIHDLDHINKKVHGSITSKKYMRNEIWSLIAAKGAPSWYITLSPTDIHHPISLYYATTKEEFHPEVQEYKHRIRSVSSNPVASARFFHFMVTLLITHIFGVNTTHSGAYGNTSAYYGTVEQ
ncbi:hypothetical protein BDN72DRAFT_776419, partial [Pluteus cervinus]